LSWRIAVNSFFFAGCDVFCRDLRARLFWDFAASGAGRRRPDRHCDRMVAAEAARRRKRDVEETVAQPLDISRRAFYPLTLPLTVGPASISAAITLGANAAHHHAYHPLTILAALVGLALIAISILLCYGFADRLARILGATGMTVITQLSPFFLVCIGVQIAWNGVKALLEELTLHIG
jgi:multiple antibiotic resistance protein